MPALPRRAMTRRSLLAAAAAGGGALAVSRIVPAWAAPPRWPDATVFALDVGALDRSGAHLADAWHDSAQLHAPHRFDLVGVQWIGAADAAIQLRARRQGADWSAWTEAGFCRGHAPDRVSDPRLIGEPVWTGSADLAQVRSDRPIRGVRLHFVNVTGTATPAARARRALTGPARVAALRLARPRYAAGPGQPPIIAREVWAAGHAAPRRLPDLGEVRLAFVHHTETANAYSRGDSPAMIRAIFHYHRDVEGWDDIGYNFLVDRFGQIFEGRGGGIDEAVVGAQAGGYNQVSTGVGTLGSFQVTREPAGAQRATAHLLAWKLALHGVPTEGRVTVRVDPSGARYTNFRAGARVTLPRVAGHRDGDSTDCPGNALYHQLPAIRTQVSALAGPRSELTLTPPSTPSAPSVMLVGQLRLGGRPVSGATIEIQERARRGRQALGNAVTGVDGTWSVTVALSRRATLRAATRGDGHHPAVLSNDFEILPSASIQLQAVAAPAPASTPGAGAGMPARSIAVSGTIAPAPASGRVTVGLFAVDSSASPTPVLRRRVTVSGGSFSVTLAVPGPGHYRVVASSAADRSNAAGASAPVDVVIT